MNGRRDRWQEDLFVAGPLRDLIPDDHILKQVDTVLDLSWLVEEVKDTYDEAQGRPSIDPEAAVRLMLAGFFQGLVHDRTLMREAQVNLAIRWFAGYRLHETLPDHSSLTRIRQRWGAERFRRIFTKTVEACARAGLVSGKTVHVDASLIRADVSWESLTTAHADEVLTENAPSPEEDAATTTPGKPAKRSKPKKRSTTDPEATMATNRQDQRLEPTYKQHTAVDDHAGVIVDVAVTTGEVNEGKRVMEQIERIEATTGQAIEVVTADAAYAHAANYAALEAHGIDAVIPPPALPRRCGPIPPERFRYDAHHAIVRCPAGKTLHRSCRNASPMGWVYRASATDCRTCTLRARCFSQTAKARTVVIVDGYEALLRARRRRRRGDPVFRAHYTRHRWRVEGIHGEAKTQHGLRRAVRRGLDNVAIQAYLTGAAINLKRLAKAAAARLAALWFHIPRLLGPSRVAPFAWSAV